MGLKKEKTGIDGMTAVERALKRVGDVVGAIVLLIVLSPVFIYIYAPEDERFWACVLSSRANRKRRQTVLYI